MVNNIIPEELRAQGYMLPLHAAKKLGATQYEIRKYIKETEIKTVDLETSGRNYVLVRFDDLAGFHEWLKSDEPVASDGNYISITDFAADNNMPEDDARVMYEVGFLKGRVVDGNRIEISKKGNFTTLSNYKKGKINCDAIEEARRSRVVSGSVRPDSASMRLRKIFAKEDPIENLLSVSARYGLESAVERILSIDISLEPTVAYLIGSEPTSIEIEAITNLDRILPILGKIDSEYMQEFIEKLKSTRKDPFKAGHRNSINLEASLLLDKLEDNAESL